MSTRAKLAQLEQIAGTVGDVERCPQCGRSHPGLTFLAVMPDGRREPRSWCCSAPMPALPPGKYSKVLRLELAECL